MTDQWCILRTRSSSTLRLQRALEETGIPAWTPTELNVRRNTKSRKRTETIVATLPTYVFAAAERLPDLVSLRQFGPIPSFSLFRYLDRFAVVDESDLKSLRTTERKEKPLTAPLEHGDAITLPDGPYQGLTGRVVENSGKFTLVLFPGTSIPIKFASWMLEKV